MQTCWKPHPPRGKLLPLHLPYTRSRTCHLQIRWSASLCHACDCYELGTASMWCHYGPPEDDWLVVVGTQRCKDYQCLVACFSHLLYLFHCQFGNVEGTGWGEFHIWRKNMSLVGVWFTVYGYRQKLHAVYVWQEVPWLQLLCWYTVFILQVIILVLPTEHHKWFYLALFSIRKFSNSMIHYWSLPLLKQTADHHM